MSYSVVPARSVYGCNETAGLVHGREYHAQVSTRIVDWTDKSLKRITRLRLLSDPGYPAWDVSYCHGELKDGTLVHVQVPFSQLPKRNMNKVIIHYAQKDKVFAKGLRIFDAISTLN
jgi:hypothetical protein